MVAIGKLQKGENPDEFDGDDVALVDVLCDVLQYDPVACVSFSTQGAHADSG